MNQPKPESLPSLLIAMFETGKPWSTKEMLAEVKPYFKHIDNRTLSDNIYQTRHMLRNGKRRVGLRMNIERVFCDDHVWRWKLVK